MWKELLPCTRDKPLLFKRKRFYDDLLGFFREWSLTSSLLFNPHWYKCSLRYLVTASVHKQKQIEAGHSCQLVLCTLCSCELSICKKRRVKMRKSKCIVANVNSKTEFWNNCLGRDSTENCCGSDPFRITARGATFNPYSHFTSVRVRVIYT